MSITSANIKLRQSERMTDFTDGGGQMSASEVVDGVLDNVFDDRSELDAILGRASIRKVYLQVASANTDKYLGALAFITDPPVDSNVSVTMFDTQSWTDLRAAAASYVENYRIEGVKTQFVLYGNHIAGQMTIQVYCRDATIKSPDIGDVLELSIEASGYTALKQFVKVDKVLSRQTLTFEDVNGTFARDVLIIATTTQLNSAFPGIDQPIRIPATLANCPTVIRSTQISASSSYYGVSPLAMAAAIGDRTVKIESPYVHVVPSSASETPLTDVLAGAGSIAMVPCGAANGMTMSSTGSAGAGASSTFYFGSPFACGSLSVSVSGSTLVDDGIGNVASSVVGDTTWSGTCDYSVGSFTIAKTATWSGTVAATATPAGAVVSQAYSAKIPVTAATRQFSYVAQLPNQPSVGTLIVDYLALGKWVRLIDQGNGTLAGNPGEGAGTINYATGSIALTLGSYPDNDSDILLYWGVDLRTRDVHGEITVPTPTLTQQLAHGGNQPGTCMLTWTSATVSKSATVGSDGTLSGHATGRWDFSTGLVTFVPDSAADAGFTFDYEYVDPTKMHSEVFTPSAAGGSVTFTLAHLPAAGSVTAQWTVQPNPNPMYLYNSYATTLHAHDDGTGAWVGAPSGTNSIDYGTGVVVLPVSTSAVHATPQYSYQTFSGNYPNTSLQYSYVNTSLTGWSNVSTSMDFTNGSPIVVNYVEAGATSTSVSETHTGGTIQISFATGSTGAAVPGSVRFAFGGRTYVDRNGSLYYNIGATTNAGTFGGTYNYATNTVSLTDYVGGSSTVTIVGLLTRYATIGVSNVFFRTPGAPLKEGNFTWRASDLEGNDYSGAADINGKITGTGAGGYINWDTGVVAMAFGSYVTAAGNESEPWYNAANVVGSTVWKPMLVDPSTIFIGCVVFQYVPLNPTLLGLDPVRLPSDGRVLGYQRGGVVAVHNTQVTSVSSPSAGDVTNLGRTRIVFAEVKDSLGVAIDPAWYTPDLDAGTIIWANPLNLSAYTLPVKIRHRIEDLSECTDLQITGDLKLNSALTHAFPADGTTFVSACLAFGDMQARATNVFDQTTWTSVFSDVLIGTAATASYNNVLYPITVRNDSATQDRWAIVFSNSTTVSVIGEVAGNLGSFPITSDIAPTNPVSGQPYFTLTAAGWGSGWAAGNVLRFNTVAATHPIWLLRCTLQGPIEEPTDQFRLQIYGDAV